MTQRRVALITGGTRGIGLGIAQALAAEGYALALCGRRPFDQVAAVCAELEDAGAEVLYTVADIAVAEDRAELLAAVKQRFGALHCLINNAGVAPAKRMDCLEAGEDSFERLMRINLQGPYFLTQAVASWMIEQLDADSAFVASIVFVGSISATVVSPERGDYCISKAGVAMAASVWAARLGEYDIPVYELRPGVTATDMTHGVKEKYDRLISEGLCVQKRWGTPADVGRAAAMLVRGDLPYATGQVLCIDGGLTLPRL